MATVLAVMATLVFGLAGTEQQTAQLAQVTYCGPGHCSWRATVLTDGTLFYENFSAPAKGGKRLLKAQEFRRFLLSVERERPWEITGTIGVLAFHGPQREIRVLGPEGERVFQLMTTPEGFEELYPTDPSQLARAIRFCQTAYSLLGESSLPDCVDGRP